MTLSAQELYKRGRAHLNAGRNAAARRLLLRAAERTDDPDLIARIDGSLAALVIRQGDPQTAERMCADALSRPGLSRATSAMLEGQLGLLALERGDLAAAIARFDRGIAGIGEDREHRTPMLINRSVAHMQAGHFASARADLERAAADYAAAGDDVERAMAVHNAGYVSLLEGDLVRALAAMAEARAVMEQASAVNAAICDLDRAEVLRDAGLTTEAEQSLERVARVFGAHRMQQARGEAELHLARSLLAHDPARAAKVAAAAARRFRTVDSEAWAARADGVRVRAELAEGVVDRDGMPAPASRRTPGADEIAEVARALRAHGLAADATAVELAGRLRGATDGGRRRAPGRLPAAAPIDVRLLAHRVAVRSSLDAGRETEARRRAAAGLDELARWQSAFASLDLQSAVAVHGLPLMMAGLSSAMRTGRADVLFEWSERARHFSQRVVPVRPSPDPAAAADLAELRSLRAESGPGDWLATPRAAELHDRVRRRQWSATGSDGLDDHVSMAELAAMLDDDTAVLSYVWSAERVACVVVTSGGAVVREIPEWPRVRAVSAGLRADLDVSAAVRSGPLAAAVRASLEDRLGVLSRVLIAPALAGIAQRRLVITAPGVLNGMPWAMLPDLRGRVFTVAVSASRWARADRGARLRATAGFAVGPRVARGAEEIERAARAWGTPPTLRDQAASVDAVTRLASRVDVLHVAAHGRHAVDNPLFSGLELADGTLFGYDIDRVAAVPQTVVLSACEVGRSSVRWGEEALGMTRVWLHAGAGCVIAAPVVVADDHACELLGALHDELARGAEPAEALAAASGRTGVTAPFQAHGAGF
ncbi:CHAT domain-containing protein [Microbacterium aureliae]